MTPAAGRAFARAALLGNPSDGYGGKTISITIRNFAAEVTVEEAAHPAITPAAGGPLLGATLKRFTEHCAGLGLRLPETPLEIRYRTTIPREVGLGGSSAIVIATLRALCALRGVSIPKETLPSLALSVETDELGIPAGPQDRVAQTYEGLTYMDFDPAHTADSGHGLYESLDPSLLPPLFIAYRTDAAQSSAGAHADLRRRAAGGAAEVAVAMRELADVARRGRECLVAGDHDELARLLDRNLELRRALHPLDPRHLRMVELARSLGACANYAGSGGAIVGIVTDEGELARLRHAFELEGCAVISPIVA